MEKAMKSCIAVPEILLPRAGTDMHAWAVIACDQHTSDSVYWSELEKTVGEKPSTLRLTLPEIYLDKADCAERIGNIAKTMREYRNGGVFGNFRKGLYWYAARRRIHLCGQVSFWLWIWKNIRMKTEQCFDPCNGGDDTGTDTAQIENQRVCGAGISAYNVIVR